MIRRKAAALNSQLISSVKIKPQFRGFLKIIRTGYNNRFDFALNFKP